jgi:hypothetical protein
MLGRPGAALITAIEHIRAPCHNDGSTGTVAENMKYGLAILTLDNWPFIEITAEAFQGLKLAHSNVATALAVEEKFEILIENYSEYEQTLLNLTLRKMIRQDYEMALFADDRQVLNRRIANVLTSARLYINQTQHDFATAYGAKSPQLGCLRAAFSREYDQSLGYRVMEAIRNYVQHRALPVGTLTYQNGWHEENGEQCLRRGIDVELDVDGVRNDDDFRPDVLRQIEQNTRARDLTLMIRQFIEGLSRVHTTRRVSSTLRHPA